MTQWAMKMRAKTIQKRAKMIQKWGQRGFNTNTLEVGGDEIVGLQYGQDDVDEPESDEEDGREPLSCRRPSRFPLAEEAGITMNQEDADDHHGADRVQKLREPAGTSNVLPWNQKQKSSHTLFWWEGIL